MTIVGPLFWKELIESARRARYYAVRSIVAGIVLTTLLSLSEPLAKNQVSETAAIGRQLLEQWAWFQLSALVVFVPAFASGLVAGEKDHKTIDALFTSCLTDREILWGKLASRLYAVAIIVASSIPVIVLLSFLGGFGPKELMEYVLVQFATAVLCAVVGLYYSVISSKPYVALIRAYFVLLVVWLLTPLLAWPISSLWPRLAGPTPVIYLIDSFSRAQMCVNPFVWLAYDNAPVAGMAGVASWSPPPYIFVGFALMVSAMLFWRSQRLLREAAYWQRVPRIWRWVTTAYAWLVRRTGEAVERRSNRRFFRRLWDWELKSRSWGSWERRYGLQINPLFFRRATANVYDPERYIAGLQMLAWLVVLGLVLLGGYLVQGLLADSDNLIAFLGVELPILVVVLVILASSSIAREADRGSLDVLLLTSLTARQILIGTTWGVFRTAWPITFLVIFTMIIGGFATLLENAIVEWILTLVPLLVCLVSSSILISIAARRTMAGVTAGLAAPIFFVAVPTVLDRLRVGHLPITYLLVVAVVAVLMVLRVTRQRRSLLMATLLSIVIPLFCLLTVLFVNDLQPTRDLQWWYGNVGPWSDLNYARWLLEPLRLYRVRYFGPDDFTAVHFGFAQCVAAVWMFMLARKDLDRLLGRPVHRTVWYKEPVAPVVVLDWNLGSQAAAVPITNYPNESPPRFTSSASTDP